MGIKGLIPFLKSKCTFKEWSFGSEKITSAIDVPIFAHKFIYVERTYKRLEAKFIEFGLELRSKNIEPIFVFDGEKLELKDLERAKRLVKRSRQEDCNNMKKSKEIESYIDLGIDMPIIETFQGILKPTQHDYANLMIYLQSQGFQVAKAKYEAEALCAHLVCNGLADIAITEDTDAIAFGSKKTLFKFLQEPLYIEYEKVIQDLQLSSDQFTDLCCMLGCDFCDNVFNVGPETAYSLIKKYGSWPLIFEKMEPLWPIKTKESAILFNERYINAKKCLISRAFELDDTSNEPAKNAHID